MSFLNMIHEFNETLESIHKRIASLNRSHRLKKKKDANLTPAATVKKRRRSKEQIVQDRCAIFNYLKQTRGTHTVKDIALALNLPINQVKYDAGQMALFDDVHIRSCVSGFYYNWRLSEFH